MYTIQFETVGGEHKMQDVSSHSRQKLYAHLARFERPIVAVYEQASPITKLARKELQTWPGTLSQHAREFAFRPPA